MVPEAKLSKAEKQKLYRYRFKSYAQSEICPACGWRYVEVPETGFCRECSR